MKEVITVQEVDIIIPVHGDTPWLELSLKSIFNQKFSNFRIVIVVDRLATNLDSVLSSFDKNNLKKIIVLKSPGSGIAAALNFGLNNSNAEFIARFDSDDVMHPLRIEKQVNYLLQNPEVGMVGSQAFICDQDLNVLKLTSFPTSHKGILREINITNPICHPSITLRRTALKKSGNYNPEAEGFEDLELWLRLSKISKVKNLRLPLIKYRTHSRQITTNIGNFSDNFIKAHRMNYLWKLNKKNDSTIILDEEKNIETYLNKIAINRSLVTTIRSGQNKVVKWHQIISLLIFCPEILVYDIVALIRRLGAIIRVRFYSFLLRRSYSQLQ
jgi:glycosyltransferase involved in cell wall biosynthesis